METFKQPKIVGYRQLSTQEVELMNEGKLLAAMVGNYVDKLQTMPTTVSPGPRMHSFLDADGKEYDLPSIDQRWVHIGAAALQQGFMALTRSIAQPTTF